MDTETKRLESDGPYLLWWRSLSTPGDVYYIEFNKGWVQLIWVRMLSAEELSSGSPLVLRKLSSAFSTPTANVYTWIRKEGFAISLSLDGGRPCDFPWI